MAKDNRIRMPSSQGGLVQYYDSEYPSKIMIKPLHVIIFVAALCIIGLVLRLIL